MSTKYEAAIRQTVDHELEVRRATRTDAAAIWRLVCACETLDNNSCYAYLLLCSDFADTCFVSHIGDLLAGFVAAYVPPKRTDAVFVWQIGVDPQWRGQGIGRQLLSKLVENADEGVQYLEATVTPANQASRKLFQSFADARGWTLSTSRHFDNDLFANPNHEAEELIRIGPFKD